MRLPQLNLLASIALVGCSGSGEAPVSELIDPTVVFDQEAPEVNEEWPCPPYDGRDGRPYVTATGDEVGDSDLDSLTDCQEKYLGSDPSSVDSDQDGISDQFEYGDRLNPRNSDGDDLIDLLDPDDDGDGVSSLDEGSGDVDGDGIANYLDKDDDNDRLTNREEDLDGDGDPRNDDAPDGDGIPNWLDPDDDGDGVCCGLEDTNGNLTAADDDSDGDSLFDWEDPDDDGDQCPTLDEDADGDGDWRDDDADLDRVPDYLDADTAICVPTETFVLTVDGRGFVGVNGTSVLAVVLDGAAVVSSGSSVVAGGRFEIVFPDPLNASGTYSVDVLLDDDGDGSCFIPEETFRLTGISSTGEDLTERLDAGTDAEASACGSFP